MSRYLAIIPLLFSGSAALTAPGELSDVPLFLGNTVKPNVLFVMDDSGSMENEILLTQDALTVPQYFYHPNSGGATGRNIDPPYNTSQKRLQMCVGYNALAYNPNQSYTPWNSTDANGTAYSDQAITSTRKFVFGRKHNDINDTSTINFLSSSIRDNVGYTRWDDDNGNGKFDPGECGERNISGHPSNADIDPRHFVSITSMSASEQQNFANWYSYHRKRRFALNGPMIDILNTVDLRVGLATINRDGDVAQEVIDISEGNNRERLLLKFQDLGQSQSTPLRRPLENAGRYFAEQSVDTNFVSRSTSPASPILPANEGGVCQQNYTLLMTDGYSNENSGTMPRLNIGNADGDNNSPFDGGDYGDSYSDTLGDIAMHFYEGDLKPNDTQYPDIVTSNDVNDTNSAQHMVTSVIAFGVKGNLDAFPEPGQANWPRANPSDNLWSGEKQQSIDDLLHAAYNGRGKFLSALNPTSLKESLINLVESISAASEGSAASVGFNSTNISSGTVLYQSRFFSNYWNGTLQAFDFSRGTIEVCPNDPSLSCPMVLGDNTTCPSSCSPATEMFDAGEALAERVADLNQGHNSRQIITFNGVQGIPFRFPSDVDNPTASELSTEQVNDLIAGAGNNNTQVYGERIVNFLRGDNQYSDGAVFRDRNGKVLGDIAHSSPQIVGAPEAIYPNHIESSQAPYQTFRTNNANRNEVVYVGANDGMLHAFDADNGKELFAYIPSMVFSTNNYRGLHWLADPQYNHIPFVDGTPTAGDVFINNQWRTYLVGGLGAGGQGIYVLDITNPNLFSENNAASVVKMEFTHNDLGYTFSRPQIAKLNNGKWAAVFGNGYGGENGDGRAKLFILYLDGSGYKLLDTGVGNIVNGDCLNSNSDCNGLSSPTLIDTSGDAILDRVYAGDLHGNMWAFDLSDTNPNNWKIAHQNSFDQAKPLFQACNAYPCTSSNRQAITAEPIVTGHATESSLSTSPNALVLFGTGQYLNRSDISDARNNSFYAVWDAGPNHHAITRDHLTEQSIDTSRGMRTLSQNTVTYSTNGNVSFGWYIDLPSSRERVVIKPILAGELILFATSIPDTSACGSGGSGFLMAADIFSGSRPNFQVFESPLQSAVALMNLPVGAAFIDNRSVIPDSTGGIESIRTNVTHNAKSRRVSWSELRKE